MDLLKGWTIENRRKLKKKMEKLGIQQGGIFICKEKNNQLYTQLTQLPNDGK